LSFLEGSEGASPEPTDVLGGDPPTGVTVPASGIGFAATPSTPGDGGGTGSHLSEVLSSTSLSSSEDGFTSSGGEGGEALLLPQQVIHIVPIEALLPPDPLHLRPGCPVPLTLLPGAVVGLW
jgi:hypothetical protein